MNPQNIKKTAIAFRYCFNQKQQGIAALGIILFLFIVLSGCFAIATGLTTNPSLEKEKTTNKALAQAKVGIISYMSSVQLHTNDDCGENCTRPGDLPCPDINNDGIAETYCGNASGSQQENRLGRLPWKTLKLPDLRDGDGERLWYAVSNNFKNNEKKVPLNSDTPGTITLRDNMGNIQFDGSTGKGLVALIIAPGSIIGKDQNRDCKRGTSTDDLCVKNLACGSAPTLTNLCNPKNYLDTFMGIDDNSHFTDSNNDGFVSGPIKDINGNMLVNDRFITISTDEIIPQIEKRVLQEVRLCLTSYAKANHGRYPWATKILSEEPLSFKDAQDSEFGHIPASPFLDTRTSAPSMGDQWTNDCKILSDKNWWYENKWREYVFYQVATDFSPSNMPAPTSCINCLKITSSSSPKQFVIVASGKTLPGQTRSDMINKNNIRNYLELENATLGDKVYQQSSISPAINDQTAFWPIQ